MSRPSIPAKVSPSKKAHTLTIRCGFELVYEASHEVPALLFLRPRSDSSHPILEECSSVRAGQGGEDVVDVHGNRGLRVVFSPGENVLRHDLLAAVPSTPERTGLQEKPVPVSELPAEVLRYILPSRYCDSDRLMDFAFNHFGETPHGLPRVLSICDWVHRHITYRWGAGSQLISASEAIEQGFGVCRDFAHVAIALCRCFNLPARYLTAYLPDIAFQDPGTPMDFHASFQVYLGHRWIDFDARFNVPRIGRLPIAVGLDAVDAAFSTVFGAADLKRFDVWAYQIDPSRVRLGDPVDLNERLDGTLRLRIPGVS
jgi:transglutaminase-like putative cysteine protease